MHDETIAIHAGYEADGTHAVAVPIYMSVANEFIDADHAERDHGPRDSRFSLQPHQQSYERRAREAHRRLGRRHRRSRRGVRYGRRQLRDSDRRDGGVNFVVAPQLYGATYTYFAHVLSTLGIEARFAVDDPPNRSAR